MQASYTDIILIVRPCHSCNFVVPKIVEQNKWEHISERELDFVFDHLNTLNELTTKIRCKGRNGVDPKLIFGIESDLFLDSKESFGAHHDEVETITLYRGLGSVQSCRCSEMPHEYFGGEMTAGCLDCLIDEKVLTDGLNALSKEVVWRVKGFVRLERGMQIVNWAFGRYELTAVGEGDDVDVVKLTVMGERGAVKGGTRRLAKDLGATVT